MQCIDRPQRGVVLIFVAGILAILAAMGMAFFTLTQSSTISSVRYSDMVRADLLARAGIEAAIAQLRQRAFDKTEDPSDPWFRTDYLHNLSSRISFAGKHKVTGKPLPYSGALSQSVIEEGDRYTLQVSDAASRININAGDNLAVILDNLCRLIGPPLVAANQAALQPRRWADLGASAALYSLPENAADKDSQRDLCFRLGTDNRPVVDANGIALYGDGYAIAGYRSLCGRFDSVEGIRRALTYVERNGNGAPDDPLEQFELEAKYAALKDYLTTDSWVDTTTIGVGKFEWAPTAEDGLDVRDIVTGKLEQGVYCQILIDRDKSWVMDKPIEDPLNTRGSLRGSYVSIMNGHGAGQLRRIATNGADWIALRADSPNESLEILPGPISSYLIVAREDAELELVAGTNPPVYLPKTDATGNLVDAQDIDYTRYPLCIHRAPVNINTASDKVLAALFMGLDVQHGHPMAVGTDADRDAVRAKWYITPDPKEQEPYLLTFTGLKRVPVNSGALTFDRPRPAEAVSPDYDYLNNYQSMTLVNEAQELAFRIIYARQATDWTGAALGNDPLTGYPRGPFTSWDGF